MSTVPYRKLIVKPFVLGTYSRAIIIPAWWLKLNSNPEDLEINLSLDSLIVTPARKERENDQEQFGVSEGGSAD